MDLRQLRYFIAVAEEEHITRAAERLGMQQPPLSQQIKAIERELDVQLFRRRARGVELTEAGRSLLDDARAILAQVNHALEATRRTARGERGRICVGATATAAFHPFVSRVVREFREAFPLVSLTLEEQLSLQLIEAVRNERIDVAFIRTPVANPEGLVVNPLLEEALVVALPSSRARARNSGGGDRSMSFKALAGETFIFYGRQPIYDATIAACHAAGFSPRVGQEADRVASALNLVAVGMGICVVPASLQRMKLDGVAYRGLTGAIQPKAVLNLISQRGDPSAVVRQFVNLVKRSTKDLPADRRKSR